MTPDDLSQLSGALWSVSEQISDSQYGSHSYVKSFSPNLSHQ
jgi:hypothetical protein